jgi:hypothetical protein
MDAHIDHPGNKQADKQAKLGATPRQGPGPWHWYLHPEPVSLTNLNQKSKINDQWQKQWIKNPTECWQSKCFIQNIAQM